MVGGNRGGRNEAVIRVRVVVEAVEKGGVYHRMFERSLDYGPMTDAKVQDQTKTAFTQLASVLEANYDAFTLCDRKRPPAAQLANLSPNAMDAFQRWVEDMYENYNFKAWSSMLQTLIGLRWCEAIGKEQLEDEKEGDNG